MNPIVFVNFDYLFLALILCVPAAVLLLPQYWRSREQARLLELIGKAMEAGRAVPPELLERVAARRELPSAESDLRRGLLLIAAGLGLALLGAILLAFREGLTGADGGAFGVLAIALSGLALYPGLALVVFGRWSRKSANP
jgi:hypothetical protein